MDENETLSVSVRKIDNGYVKTTSRYGGDRYESREEFSRDRPKIDQPTERASGMAKAGACKRAFDVLKKI